jgi:hypothetical protein
VLFCCCCCWFDGLWVNLTGEREQFSSIKYQLIFLSLCSLEIKRHAINNNHVLTIDTSRSSSPPYFIYLLIIVESNIYSIIKENVVKVY